MFAQTFNGTACRLQIDLLTVNEIDIMLMYDLVLDVFSIFKKYFYTPFLCVYVYTCFVHDFNKNCSLFVCELRASVCQIRSDQNSACMYNMFIYVVLLTVWRYVKYV